MKSILTGVLALLAFNLYAQKDIPSIYSHLHYEGDRLVYESKDGKIYESHRPSPLILDNVLYGIKAYNNGLSFDFGRDNLEGVLYYGLIRYDEAQHPVPVWYKRTSQIHKGKAKINILKRLSGKYDMSGWEEKGYGTLGYRIVDHNGQFLYDGIVSFSYTPGQGFEKIPAIIEGPTVNLLNYRGVTIHYKTDMPVKTRVLLDGQEFAGQSEVVEHEITINGLLADKDYEYTVTYGAHGSQTYRFHTPPLPGSRKPFVFAYASDSRSGKGGGEHDMYGVNFYTMRRIGALASSKNTAFVQFTGDLVNGYSTDLDELQLEYANWKRSIEPFAHSMPIMVAMGNHEVFGHAFKNGKGWWDVFVPGFPFDTQSPSAIFADNFVMPVSDLTSEDGASYDPDAGKTDFPPYRETVYYYTYDNVAVIVLNSNYLYTPTLDEKPDTGGNLHGYIMDNQLQWLKKTLNKLETDPNIDHIFVTQHTPAFPNSAHVEDDMYYGGNNKFRPYIAGKPVDKGIIERRDQYLNLLVNQSSKVVAILTGDEHNYNKTLITPDTPIYPEDYLPARIRLNRSIWQINNGSAGAPYYARNKKTPWAEAVSGFSTQTALVFFHVNGGHIHVKVYNPDTLELIEEYDLK